MLGRKLCRVYLCAVALGLWVEALRAQPRGYAYMAGLFSSPSDATTARVRGLADASVALGGMMGAVQRNPAGLGFFRRHSIQLSPELSVYGTELQQNRNTEEAHALRPRVLSLGGVYSFYVGDLVETDFRGGSLMVAINRSHDFFEKFNYSATDAAHTLLDYYAEEAVGLSRSEIEDDWQLAPLEAHHLLTSTGEKSYQSLLQGKLAQQTERYNRQSEHHQLLVAYGMNYKDTWYVGASAALGLVRQVRTRDYDESYDRILNRISVSDKLRTRGSSLQLGLGLIYRPLQFAQLGISAQLPTIYQLRERSTYDWLSNFDNYVYTDPSGKETELEKLSYESDILRSVYTLLTPTRLHAGLSFFFSNRGFVSGQLSLVDYSSMRIGSNDFNATSINQHIRQEYKLATNYHVGAEVRLASPFYLRSGYAYYSPISEERKSWQRYSAGLGYQSKDMLRIALSVEQVSSKEDYAPFSLENGDSQSGRLRGKRTSFFLTTTFFLYN